jgi:hypothetical protein
MIRTWITVFGILLLLGACNRAGRDRHDESGRKGPGEAVREAVRKAVGEIAGEPAPIIFHEQDQVILEDLFDKIPTDQDNAISGLMVEVGTYFLSTPYVAHTLEKGEEQLVVNLRELDCTTFAENCLAISRTIRSGEPTFERFTEELKLIRYRNGVLDGYPSRLHYFCDWIHNNQEKELIRDMSARIAGNPLRKQVNFMSTHPESYEQLVRDSSLIPVIAAQEKEISMRNVFFIPEERIAELEDQLENGDIVGITTRIEGLAIAHVGILVKRDERIHLLHASSAAKKVVISDGTLEDYLTGSESATGIMVARPL